MKTAIKAIIRTVIILLLVLGVLNEPEHSSQLDVIVRVACFTILIAIGSYKTTKIVDQAHEEIKK